MDKKIFRLLTLGIMLTIFWFSNQDANVSDTQSVFFAMFLPFLPVWVIRKIAHMTLYAILAFCAACGQIKPSFKKVLLFCACYACTDEFHQLFIPGRSGEIRDVCIDCLGACIGFLLFTGIKKNREITVILKSYYR